MKQDKHKHGYRFPLLFNPITVGGLQLKNRLVALPVHTGFANPDGSVGSWMHDCYARLARSGAGMVVVANTAVSQDGVVSRYNLRIDKDAFIPGLARLAAAIKENGAVACIQLNHAGRFAKTERPLLPSPMSSANLTFNVESLRGFMEFFPFEKRFQLTRDFLRQATSWRRAMSDSERERIIDDFAGGALRACRAGFDMVELHGANGYLLCQYLSPYTNKLSSGFGGDPARRAAFPLAVITAVQDRLPRDFPIGFRLLLREGVPGGIDLPEALAFAQQLERTGVAYLSAATGTFNSIFSRPAAKEMAKTAYLREDVGALTRRVVIPTIISGKINTPAVAHNLLRDGTADMIGLGRPLRCDPKWIKKAGGAAGKITVCINCNSCLKQVILENGFNCSRWPRQFREGTVLAHKLLTRTDKSLWLVSDINDIETFGRSKSLLFPEPTPSSLPKLMFPGIKSRDPVFESAKADLIEWVERGVQTAGLNDTSSGEVLCPSPDIDWEEAVNRVITKGDYGRIFLCAGRSGSWRDRMLYKVRGKVVALLGSHDHPKRILVPVDLSDASLLAMVFLNEGYMKRDRFFIRFVHVLTDRTDAVFKHWKRLKTVAGLNPKVPLELIRPKTDVVSALAETLHSGDYGTVVMGKRGLSGLKRWLLGSVSTGVLSRLNNQTIILVD